MVKRRKKVSSPEPADLKRFGISAERGFLPAQDPLLQLPKVYSAWEKIACDLPKLLVAGRVKSAVGAMKRVGINNLKTPPQLERAMLILSFIGHAYVWGDKEPCDTLPAQLAVPWYEVSKKLGRPPILSYASYALHNWRRIDPKGPVALGNIALLQNFLAGLDEEWFILIHVDIEAKAASAMRRLLALQKAAAKRHWEAVEENLSAVSITIEEMVDSLARMPECCDPYIYYNRVRPYIFGWKNQPTLPNGVLYQGVSAYKNQPQFFRGETGSQSSIVPALDAALGVGHREDPLKAYLKEMRDYMPPRHNAFIAELESSTNVREAVMERPAGFPKLQTAFNACISGIEKFRSLHLQYAISYIQNQKQVNAANPNEIGTGGTPFVPYLRKHRDETGKHRV